MASDFYFQPNPKKSRKRMIFKKTMATNKNHLANDAYDNNKRYCLLITEKIHLFMFF